MSNFERLNIRFRAVSRRFYGAVHSGAIELIGDEAGGETLEYALVAGLIVIAAIAVVTTVGTKVLARWNSVNSKM